MDKANFARRCKKYKLINEYSKNTIGLLSQFQFEYLRRITPQTFDENHGQYIHDMSLDKIEKELKDLEQFIDHEEKRLEHINYKISKWENEPDFDSNTRIFRGNDIVQEIMFTNPDMRQANQSDR